MTTPATHRLGSVAETWIEGLRQQAVENFEAADLFVVGAPSSGTRLLTRLLGESGLAVCHDYTHGRVERPPLKVVRIERDREALIRSVMARDDLPMMARVVTREEAEVFVDERQGLVRSLYSTRPVVSYEALVADRDAELARIADRLGIPRWQATEVVTDENAKHLKVANPAPPVGRAR